MSQIMKKAAVIALLAGTTTTDATRLQQKSFISLNEAASGNDNSEDARQNFMAAEALQNKNVFQAFKKHDTTTMDQEQQAQMHAEATADEMMHEEYGSQFRKDVKRLSMADIKYMSYNEPAKNHYAQNANLASPKLVEQPPAEAKTSVAQAAPSKEATKTEQAKNQTQQAKVQQKEGPQSGSPISDAVLDGIKKIQSSMKDDSKKEGQSTA